MSVFMLQVIAMVTMVCDHLGEPFFNNNIVLRCFGRFAFPIYAFLLAEGFHHLKNNKEKVDYHLGKLVFLALISEFCYDLVECKPFVIDKLISTQNAIITLLFAFCGLIAIEKWKDKPLFMWSTISLTALMNFLIKSNYKFAGVLLVYAFYYYLEHFRDKKYIIKAGCMIAIFLCYLPLYHWARYDFCNLAVYLEKLTVANISWYITHIGIAMTLATYKGELGFSSRKFKAFYSFFYPAHLLVLGIIYQFFC